MSSLNGTLIAEKFRITGKIAEGGFAKVYAAVCIQTGNNFAIKMEKSDCAQPQIPFESKVYRKLGNAIGIPRFFYNGPHGDWNVMVTERLGSSLEELFQQYERRFSLKTVAMLADQILSRIEFIHTKGVLHRDIKPNNILIGCGSSENQVFLVDFGLSKIYLDPNTDAHFRYGKMSSLCGTLRYASLNAHRGIELSRRDDLESFFFTIVYFARGSLPWQGMKELTLSEKISTVTQLKGAIKVDDLCGDLPTEFSVVFSYIRSLAFNELPDYEYIRQQFRSMCSGQNITMDNNFDWNLPVALQSTNTAE